MGESRFLRGEGQAALPPTKMQLGSDLLTLEFGSITGCVQGQGEYMAELTALCETSPLPSPPQAPSTQAWKWFGRN